MQNLIYRKGKEEMNISIVTSMNSVYNIPSLKKITLNKINEYVIAYL